MSGSLGKRYLAKLISSFINGLLSLAIVSIVPRFLGPVSYGAFTFLTTFFSNIIGFFDIGSSVAFYTKLSKRQNEKTILGFYFLFALFLFLLSVILISISLISVIRYSIYGNNETIYIVLGFFFAFLTWVSQIAIKISDAYALTVDIEIIKTVHRLFFFLALIVLVYYEALGLGSFFVYHLVLLLSFILILFFYFYQKKILIAKIFSFEVGDISRYIYEFYSYSHPLLIGTIFSTTSSLLGLWLLQNFHGNEQVGYYGFAYQIAAACFIFTVALTPLITREFAVAYHDGDIAKMKSLFIRYVPMLYSIAAFFSVFFAANFKVLIELFGGQSFWGAATALILMTFYPVHQTYGQLSGSVLYATENTKVSRNISILSSVVFLILSFILLLPSEYFGFGLGATGFAIAMVVTQIISVNIQLWFNVRFLKLNMNYFIFHQLYSLLIFYFLASIAAFFTYLESDILNFILSGVVYTFLVIFITYFFPQIFGISKKEILFVLEKIKTSRLG